MARPKRYTKPEQIKDKFDAYITKCEEGKVIKHINKRGQLITEPMAICPSLKGFARFLGYADQSGFEHLGKDPNLTQTVTCVKTDIALIRDQYAEQGIIEPQIARMDYAKRNNLSDSKHAVEVDIGDRLRKAMAKATGSKADVK